MGVGWGQAFTTNEIPVTCRYKPPWQCMQHIILRKNLNHFVYCSCHAKGCKDACNVPNPTIEYNIIYVEFDNISLDLYEIHQFQPNPQHTLSKTLVPKEKTHRVILSYSQVFATSLGRFLYLAWNIQYNQCNETAHTNIAHKHCTQSLCSNHACLWQRISLYNFEVCSCRSQFVQQAGKMVARYMIIWNEN